MIHYKLMSLTAAMNTLLTSRYSAARSFVHWSSLLRWPISTDNTAQTGRLTTLTNINPLMPSIAIWVQL